MPVRQLIIDGYSLLHRDPELAPALATDIRRAREQLIAKLARLGGMFADRVTLVFDGRGEAPAETDLSVTALDVVYSGRARTADTVIERMVHAAPRPAEILVVASDRAELETVAAAGAQTLACRTFLDQLAQREREAGQIRRRRDKTFRKTTLGDFFPDPET